jgi:hypothetical protein
VPPVRQVGGVGLCGILTDAADGETIQTDLPGNVDVGSCSQQVEDAGELLAAVAGLSSEIDAFSGLRVRDAGLLSVLGGLGLGLPDRAHERQQGITDRFLDRVRLRAVKGEVVDHSPDGDALPHKRLYRVADIVVVASPAIKPTDHPHVASPQLVEQAPATLPLCEAGTDAGAPLILDDVGMLFFIEQAVSSPWRRLPAPSSLPVHRTVTSAQR